MLRQNRNIHNLVENIGKIRVYQNIQRNPSNKPNVPTITIKFLGDVRQNVGQILKQFDCNSCKDRIREILIIFYSKIEKLRDERNLYRKNILEDQYKMNEKIEDLQRQLSALRNQNSNFKFQRTIYKIDDDSHEQDLLIDDKNNDFYSLKTSRFQKFNPNEISFSADKSNYSNYNDQGRDTTINMFSYDENLDQKSDGVSKKSNSQTPISEFNKIIKRTNISPQQLQYLVEEHQKQIKQSEEMFQTDKQRQLYRLGKTMDKQLWKRMVKKDVKKLSQLLSFRSRQL